MILNKVQFVYVVIIITPLAPLLVVSSVFYPLTYGMNSYKNQEKSGKTIHAEHDAISKLPNRNKKSLKKINILLFL
jgi:hypothetical protein